MFFSLFSSLSLFFQLCCFSFLYCMPFLSLPLCVHDWILGQEQDTHCLQIHTTSWLSFTSWRGRCLVLGSAQQETKGNSVHFWVNNLPGPWEPFWFWGIYDCFWMPSVQFSCSVVSDSLWPHEMQHSRPSCPLRNRFKGLDLIDRVPDELWSEVCDIVQETGIKTNPMEKKCKKAKWLSGEALQIAVKKREVKSKRDKDISIWMQSSKE